MVADRSSSLAPKFGNVVRARRNFFPLPPPTLRGSLRSWLNDKPARREHERPIATKAQQVLRSRQSLDDGKSPMTLRVWEGRIEPARVSYNTIVRALGDALGK